ncbi:putative acetyltransferase [Nonomuraea sp. LPB2021202275-12-8]|uniref:putative acetyltransferase n=1 Tax=Nonomuraea sp. LPB2021202275-12-8 TaxID=3120159 RepID=UPI003FA547EA
MAARLVITISATDVGARITTRRRVPGGFSDAVGTLESWEGGVLSVRKRDGTVVEIAEETLVAGRVVPAAPPRPGRK